MIYSDNCWTIVIMPMAIVINNNKNINSDEDNWL